MSHQHHKHHKHHEHGGAAHAHGLTISEEMRDVSDARLLWSVVLNQLLTIVQVVGGIVSGSLALLSDAAHNFSDANALLIAYIARRISRREANERYTFGYRRAELIGAMINLTTLGVVGLYLVYEALLRFIAPEPIVATVMAAVAALAIVVDVATVLLLWALARGSLNVRAAFIHNLTDALASVAVLLGAAAVIWLDWTWIDPLLTLLIAGYVLYQVATMLPEAVRILMEGSPPDLSLAEIDRAICAIEGVIDAHHLHVWQLDETRVALEAHVVLDPSADLDATKRAVKAMLRDRFAINHSTLELEREHCGDSMQV